MDKRFIGFAALASSSLAHGHALGTDPSLIERLEAGALLPTELSVIWSLWLVFALFAVQNLKHVGYLFAGFAGGLCVVVVFPVIAFDFTRVLMIPLLMLALWMTWGRAMPARLAGLLMVVLAIMAASTLFATHPELASDRLIRWVALIFTLAGASFLGGVMKQLSLWFPSQTPVGVRILSSWMVALVAIQLATLFAA